MPPMVLVRHAKSERPPGVADIDRPLARRGRTDAGLLGSFLATAFPAPEWIISSPARRARETAETVRDGAEWSTVVTIDDRLYYGGVGDLIAALEERGDEGIVAFGHEPTWSAAVNGLIGGGDVRMVTAAAACLDIPSGMRPGTASLRWLITPAALGGGKA